MLSVIIPAHNEEKFIQACLESIKLQGSERKDLEVIVVCDACTDNTYSIARKYTNKVYKVNFMNVSKTRNYGLSKAAGIIFCFLDADCIIEGNLLDKVMKKIKEGYNGGTCRTKALEDNWKAKLFWGLGHIFDHFFLTASGFMFTREKVKFRDNIKIAEDTFFILDLKKRGKVAYIKDAWIRTSSRRMEKNGYLKTVYVQVKGFFWNKNHKYDIVR